MKSGKVADLRRASPDYRATPICKNINVYLSKVYKMPSFSCAALRVCHHLDLTDPRDNYHYLIGVFVLIDRTEATLRYFINGVELE